MRDTCFKAGFGLLGTIGGYFGSRAAIRESLQDACIVGSVVICALTIISISLNIIHKWRALRAARKSATPLPFPAEENP